MTRRKIKHRKPTARMTAIDRRRAFLEKRVEFARATVQRLEIEKRRTEQMRRVIIAKRAMRLALRIVDGWNPARRHAKHVAWLRKEIGA